jgi:hypothetical protein
MLQKLDGVLSLRKNHARWRLGNRDAEKEGQISEIGHGKLIVQLRSKAPKKGVRGGGDDDVVHI